MILKNVGTLDPDGKNLNPLTNKPYSKLYAHISENGAPNLNVIKPGGGWKYYRTYNEKNKFFRILHQNQAVLVLAGTGVGKTVIIPRLMSHYFDYKKPIIITIPTIKAVVSMAKYTSKFCDCQYGLEVAARTAEINDEYDPSRTKMLYCTDGFVTGKISSNPLLSEYGGIIIDEVHTRGTNIDILISKVTEIAKVRPDFKIVAMSATVDPTVFEYFFNRAGIKYELYEIEGVKSNFELKHEFSKTPVKMESEYQGVPMIDKIVDILKTRKVGNILCFITSENTAKKNKLKLQEILDKNPSDFFTIPWIGILTGKSSDIETDICKGDTKLADLPEGKYGKYTRKVIFATNAVEFSVTFDAGLDFVIDSGLENSVTYDADLNCIVQGNILTAKSNIGQRCGRTGRTGEGTCIRTYTEKVYNGLLDYAIPDIKKSNITDQIIGFLNTENTNTFSKCNAFLDSMISPISLKSKRNFFGDLMTHNILGSNGRLTPLGKMINLITGQYNYKMKIMLVASYYFGCAAYVIQLICVISVTSSLKNLFINSDLLLGDFKGTRKEKDKLIKEIEIKNYKPFMHSSGDHITMLNVYNSTLMYMDNPKEREKYCISKNINYLIIQKIDEKYGVLAGDKIEEGVFKHILPKVVILELFDVLNSDHHKKLLREMKEEMIYNPALFYINGGGGSRNKSKSQRKDKHIGKDKHNKSHNKNIKPHPIEDIKPLNYSRFVKNFERKRQNSKKIARQDSKKQTKKLNRWDNQKNQKNKNNAFMSPEYKKKLRELSGELDKIQFKDRDRRFPIKISKNATENVLSCLFFSHCSQVGIKSDEEDARYLLKQNKTFNIRLYDSNSIINSYKIKHDFIVYNSLTFNKAMNKKELSIVSGIPKEIIRNFGFNIK